MSDDISDLSFMFSECENLISIKSHDSIHEINMSNDLSSDTNILDDLIHEIKFSEISPENQDILNINNNIDYFLSENIERIDHLFFECNSLISIPDISNWNTSNITDMSFIFCGCNSLKSIPDISLWNTSKVENMSYMFKNCSSLISLPDISNWNISKVKYMKDIFYGCHSLKSLPDISKWDANNEKI